jgi:hypothetical protein
LPAASREYELVLMLDPEMPEERREQIASEARRRIESGGALKHDTAWGMRKLAYEIRQRTEPVAEAGEEREAERPEETSEGDAGESTEGSPEAAEGPEDEGQEPEAAEGPEDEGQEPEAEEGSGEEPAG